MDFINEVNSKLTSFCSLKITKEFFLILINPFNGLIIFNFAKAFLLNKFF